MDDLYSVLTLSEVAYMWCKHPSTVRYALGARRKPLVFRPTPRAYLITYASCVRRWGKPIRSIS